MYLTKTCMHEFIIRKMEIPNLHIFKYIHDENLNAQKVLSPKVALWRQNRLITQLKLPKTEATSLNMATLKI